MAATTKLEVEGVAKALKILNSVDRTLAKELKAQLRASVKPVVSEARRNVPNNALSNWGSWRTPNGRDLSFQPTEIRKGIRYVQRVSGERRNSRTSRTIPLLQLRNQSAVGTIFELAGATSSTTFTRNIERRHGPPKRVLYKAWDRNSDKVQRDVEVTVRRIEQEVTRTLQ
jgi:hypothetical protein